jgi:hypothetical protein
LACLEVLVHIRDVGLIPTDYRFCEVEVPDFLVRRWSLSEEETLANIESPVLSREYGDEWSRRTTKKLDVWHYYFPEAPSTLLPPVQAVPSVIIPREMNYLISTLHPQFNELIWGEPKPFRFDPRLIATAK